MNKSPLWKVLLLVAVVAGGFLYALPNIFGEDAALLVSPDSGDAATPQELNRVEAALKRAGIAGYASRFDEQGRVEIRLAKEAEQLPAADALKRTLGHDYIVAMTMMPRTPGWLLGLGGKPMALGLDLRGGVHFLMEVDVEYVLDTAAEQYARDLPSFLRNQEPPIRYTGRRQVKGAVELAIRRRFHH